MRRGSQLATKSGRSATTPSVDKAKAARHSRGRSFTLAPTVSIPTVIDKGSADDRQFRQLLYDISIASAHLESARAYLAGHVGVTSPQYNILMVVAQYQGSHGMTGSEVATHLHVTNTFVTAEVKKLVAAGLMAKEPNPDDARSVLLHLTAIGEAKIRALEPELLFVNDHLFRHLSREDFNHLSRIVASLIDDFIETIALLGARSKTSKALDARGSTSRSSQRIKRVG